MRVENHDDHSSQRRAVLGALLAVAVAACSGGANDQGAAPPAEATLQSVALGSGPAYAAVGAPRALALTGRYSDGGVATLTTGVTWTSSDETVASVVASGVVMPWAPGTVRITATHQPSGLTATLDLTARAVVAVKAVGGASTSAGAVDTTTTLFRVSGLTPGAVYAPTVSGMSDDVDLAVYADPSTSPESELCASGAVGTIPESCEARANGFGELWISIDGQWTQAGATFTLDVARAQPPALAATLAFADLPYTGQVGRNRQYYAVTGLTPGVKYEVRISGLDADIDLEVFADRYRNTSLCESYRSGTDDDACDAVSGATTEFLIEIDGETSPSGGSFTLSVTPK